MSDITFDGRVALVAGGAWGLGAAYCRESAARGAAVVVHDNDIDTSGEGSDPAPAKELAAAIVAQGGRAIAFTADVSTESGGSAAVELAVREFGRLDVIVANAGIIHEDPLEDWSTERFEALLLRIDDYSRWLERFDIALRHLPERQRQASLLPLLVGYRHPNRRVRGSFAPTDRFRTAVSEAGIGVDGQVPGIDRSIIEKYCATSSTWDS